jgi:hypothetical protein
MRLYGKPDEPLPGDGPDLAHDPQAQALLAESVTSAMLVLLESLSPSERAAFVLHDIFGYPHDEVGAMLGRSPAAVRQLLEDGCTVLFKGDGERSQDRYTWVVDCSSTGPIRRDTSRPAKTFQEICAVYVGEHRASKGEPSPNFPFKGCSDFECDLEEIHAEIELLMANGVVACAYINTDTDPCITWHVSLPDPGALPDSVQFSERGPDLQAVAERYWSRRGE